MLVYVKQSPSNLCRSHPTTRPAIESMYTHVREVIEITLLKHEVHIKENKKKKGIESWFGLSLISFIYSNGFGLKPINTLDPMILMKLYQDKK